jgi:hypothetical protein
LRTTPKVVPHVSGVNYSRPKFGSWSNNGSSRVRKWSGSRIGLCRFRCKHKLQVFSASFRTHALFIHVLTQIEAEFG